MTVGLNVTVRCGFCGIARLELDMDETRGVVSELDAMATSLINSSGGDN
jgi:hypothetical protein